MGISLILAFLVGFTDLLSRSLNSQLDAKIGMKYTVLTNYLTGALGAFLVFLAGGGRIPTPSEPLSWQDAPAFFGGLGGIIVVWLSAYLVPRLPATVLTLAMFLGQLFSGMTIDLIRDGRTPIGKAIGFVLILAGLFVSFPPKRRGGEKTAGGTEPRP